MKHMEGSYLSGFDEIGIRASVWGSNDFSIHALNMANVWPKHARIMPKSYPKHGVCFA